MTKAAVAVAVALMLAAATPGTGERAAPPTPPAPASAKPANAAAPLPIPCDRACMEAFADRFLNALAARDPQSLPLAGTVRYTETGQEIDLGDGLWGTASDVGKYRHVFVDPATGQIGLFATMKENGRPFVMGARLKLELGRLSEIEIVLYRSGSGPAWNDAGVARLDGTAGPRPLWLAPARGRTTRQELIAAADAYFDAIQRNDGRGRYPFTDDCDRLENGVYTTNNPGLVRMGDVDIGALPCKAQFETGLYGIVTRVHHRRYPLVDEEKGVVFALVVFDHAGTIPTLTMPSGRTVDVGRFNRPSSILLAEAFKIRGGLIQQVEAVGTSVPYHMHPGWGDR